MINEPPDVIEEPPHVIEEPPHVIEQTRWDPAAPLSRAFLDAVSGQLAEFLSGQRPVVAAMGPELDDLHRMATDLLGGGKRLRPAFCFWGYVAAAGLPSVPRPLLTAAASLDLLHVSALVHDDVMDASDLRRGQPAAHRQFEALHTRTGSLGAPDAFGRAGAILLGDLLLMWSSEMLQRSGMDPTTLDHALPLVEAMRTEVTCGQYLDVLAQSRPFSPDPGAKLALDEANRVVEYKSARYTVQRPTQFGAALGGADATLLDALAAYGSPLGRAFQFRDDVLGVFGDPAVTGKPSGDDLREGKRTVLIAHTYARTTDAGRRLLVERLGDPALDVAGIAALQDVIDTSGARGEVEAMIEDAARRSLTALASAEVTDDGRTALTRLAHAAVRRTF